MREIRNSLTVYQMQQDASIQNFDISNAYKILARKYEGREIFG
jgi:hypothetical protein